MAQQLLEEARQDYYHWKKVSGVSPNTLKNIDHTLRRLMACSGNIYCHQITERTVQRFLEEMSRTQQSSTVANHFGILGGFLDWCRHTKRVKGDHDPMYGMRSPKRIKKERERVNPAHFPEILEAAGRRSPRDRAAVAVLLYTLARDSEAREFRIGDVDLESGYILARITKSHLEDRVPICAELDTELRSWLTYYTSRVGPLQPHYRLLPARRPPAIRDETTGQFSPSDSEVLRPTDRVATLSRVVNPALADIGFTVTTPGQRQVYEGAHTLRRSGARALFDRLVSESYDGALRVVQSMLHHSSVQTTEHYLGITSDRHARDQLIKGRPMYARPTGDVVRLAR